MDAAASHQSGGRGLDLLLHHCVGLSGLERERPTARERLESVVGVELARMLVGALAGRHSSRGRA